MIGTLLGVHLLLLIFLYSLLNREVGRVVAIVFVVYMGAFMVLKPALMYYYDLYLPYSSNDDGPVESTLVGTLIFLLIQYAGIRLLSNYRPPKAAIDWYDYDQSRPVGVSIVFAFLMLVSFVGCAIKFGTFSYLLSDIDTFDAAMQLADGSWYINYLAEMLFYGLLMAVAYAHRRLTATRSFLFLVLLLAFTYFWVKLASRTGILVILVAWLACFLTGAQQRRLNFILISAFGYLLLVLLYVGNFARLGNLAGLDLSTALVGAVFGAASDLSPVDNAVLLYSDISRYGYTYFYYVLGAITPVVLIPSSIFPLKLPADKDAELTRIFFPNGADTAFYHEGSTLTFTVPGSGYADAGYLGVLVASAIYVLLFCWYIWIYRRGSPSAKFIAAYLMFVHIVGFRLSIETLLISFYTSLLFFGLTRWMARTEFGFRPTMPARAVRRL